MADRIERVTTVTDPQENAAPTREVREVQADQVSGARLAARLVWFVAGVLLVLLAFRFALALLNANPDSGFANFIYDASHPFVAPFFNLFSYDIQANGSRVEVFTLVAMVVYALVAYGITRLLLIAKPNREV